MTRVPTPITLDLSRYEAALAGVAPIQARGRVVQVVGITAEAEGVSARLGEVCHIIDDESGRRRAAEVVGFRNGRMLLMPLDTLQGLSPSATVVSTGRSFRAPVGAGLLGRVVDGLGQPIDGLGPIEAQSWTTAMSGEAPTPMTRTPINEPFVTGVRAIDALTTMGIGQRMGIFAGSGVGKSSLLGMIARFASADVNVIALIGERGREVRAFLEEHLGPEGLGRSVVVVATSDQPALLRIKAAWLATSIAEWFRDGGSQVLLLMDSLTRFALAQREIGLAVGEPPAVRGYTPSVFALLPALLERAGTSEAGSITGVYTVLVEGDDLQEPIADATRAVLDGHLVLSRSLAHEHHYPAIDVLQSVSRLAVQVQSPEHQAAAGRMRELLAAFEEARDLISIGAYQSGSNPAVDYMIRARPDVNGFLRQGAAEATALAESITGLLQLAPPIEMPLATAVRPIVASDAVAPAGTALIEAGGKGDV